MNENLTGKVALVTGAGRGVGAAVARILADSGARVVVNDLNPDRAQRAVDQIISAGGAAVAVVADVANRFQCVHLVETTRATYGQLDILINGARIVPAVSVLKMDEWAWERCLNVNLKGAFMMSQLCGRVMADENSERGGVIVNLCTQADVRDDWSELAAFQAGQAGLVAFSRVCAHEFAAYGIRVHAVLAPATVQAEDGRPAIPAAQEEEIAQAVLLLCAGQGHDAGAPVLNLDSR